MDILVHTVRAFTAHGNGGSPAGVVLDTDNLTEDQMQTIARKVGFAETAFVLPAPDADTNVRFFDPETEVDLCGHATIATWFLLHSKGQAAVGNHMQNTEAGKLGIEVLKGGRFR